MGYDARQAAKAWNLLSTRDKASPLPFALYLQIPDFSGFFASGFYTVREWMESVTKDSPDIGLHHEKTGTVHPGQA